MIRKAQVDDVIRIAEILVFNNRLNYYPIFKDINYSFKEYNVLSVALDYKKNYENILVFEEEEILKGFIQIKDKEITKLYVDYFFQREGIGSRLISFAIENYGVNHLWALEKNEKALRFYKKHGFIYNDEKKLEEGTSEYLLHLVKKEKETVDIGDFALLNEISEDVFITLKKHINHEERISTRDLLIEAHYDAEKFKIEDLNRIDYNLNKLAKKDNIILEAEFAKGLFIGTSFLVPYKIIKNKI